MSSLKEMNTFLNINSKKFVRMFLKIIKVLKYLVIFFFRKKGQALALSYCIAVVFEDLLIRSMKITSKSVLLSFLIAVIIIIKSHKF